MRPSLVSLASTIGLAVLMASCASSAGSPAQGALVNPKPCPATGECTINVTMYVSGTLCYFLSDNIDIAANASVDMLWRLLDSSGNPVTTKFKFVPGNDGVVIRPPDGYSNPRNNVQTFTWHHDPQSAGDDVVELNISGKWSACMPWHAGTNPYIRNR